ncbi:MAG: primosomal protein N' [Flammeovirgaceae bacterium]|nr:primosomal protein N' [Flammeovirgaceae bacterium]MBE60870.1 primosomal protein N' [Flammeovirgaceae bacterium]HCX22420.1 primosomal protein N' [Cytophagales bacterium]
MPLRFLEVILPIPLPGTFTYSFSEHLYPDPQIGSRVIVQFGKRKIYTGIISDIHDNAPESYQPKDIMDLVDQTPIITTTQLEFFDWISRYYMCTIGEVMNAALPAGLKISSESYLSINPEIDLDDLDLSEKEEVVIRHLMNGDLKLNDVGPILDIKSPYNYVKKLKEKNVIQVFEQVKDKYSPKKETWIRLNEVYNNEDTLDQLCESLESKEKQLEVLLAYLRLVPLFEYPGKNKEGVSKKHLTDEGISTSSLKTLTKKGFFEEWDKTISRLDGVLGESTGVEINLSDGQQTALDEILSSFEKKSTVLLHGVTGSGKTELYISLIQNVLANGGQVLYLLPEIALTTQIIKRLSKVFGDEFGVFHSRYSDNERVEVWQKVQKGEYNFVVGVRSAVFLPFSDLSLIIVDEEHEPSFKQYEPAPRYHARDTSIYLASLFHGKTLLGTATPAIETYTNALEGKYGLVQLTERFGSVSLPKVSFANLVLERKQNKMKGNFSHTLLKAINETLERKKQVILFQNRRGYAPYVTCHNCGYIPKCPHCDVSLTYHSYQNLLVCHYCGYKTDMLQECFQCQSTEIKTMSFGTEKIEEDLEIMIPEARVRRMDLDSTRSKYSYQKIIDEFENGEIDILVGTQMVSKGLDFDGVELVGVFDADRIIHFPDFRSHERAYQLIHQVSGRAGRRANQGEVIIQTNDPDQPILQRLRHQDYLGFYQKEILERQQFQYPPYYRLIVITFKDVDKQVAGDAARFYSMEIRKHLGDARVNGPIEPLIGKIRNQYLFEIIIKIEKQGINLTALKEFLLNSRNILLSQRSYKSVRVIFDVDPI